MTRQHVDAEATDQTRRPADRTDQQVSADRRPERAVQRAAGNQALQRAAGTAPGSTPESAPIVTDPNGPAERQAERVANVTASAPTAPPGGPHLGSVVRRQPTTDGQSLTESPGPTPARPAAGGWTVGPAAAARIEAARSGGRPLSSAVRTPYERQLGTDLGDVRIHTGPAADRAARAVDARAFTVDRDVVFRSGAFGPDSTSGQQLLAHELTHAAQAQSGLHRQPEGESTGDSESEGEDCTVQFVEGEGVEYEGDYYVWGTYESDDTIQQFQQRTIADWVTWYFVDPPAADVRSIVAHILGHEFERHIEAPTPDCQYAIRIDLETVERAESMTGAAVVEGRRPDGAESGGAEDSEPDRSEQTVAFDANWQVLLDNDALARRYLEFLEHFTGLASERVQELQSSLPLAKSDLDALVSGAPMRAAITSLVSQGYAEFQRTRGGRDLDRFFVLEETIVRQYVRGNKTATNNQLKIGTGWEGSFGIVHRSSGQLFYDEHGMPLPAVGGPGFRDRHYQGTDRTESSGIDISGLEDAAPGVYAILNSLRQTVGDPMVMGKRAAEIYYENVELVNEKVRSGLGPKVWAAFRDQLPYFVGFLAGHGLSKWLMSLAHPVAVAAGSALNGLLTAAGYLFEIDFAGQAMEHLHEAARWLSRVRRSDSGSLTSLSKSHLEKAAKPIRWMIAQIAADAFAGGLGRGLSLAGRLRSSRDGSGRLTIECSDCTITTDDAGSTGRGDDGTTRDAETGTESTANDRGDTEAGSAGKDADPEGRSTLPAVESIADIVTDDGSGFDVPGNQWATSILEAKYQATKDSTKAANRIEWARRQTRGLPRQILVAVLGPGFVNRRTLPEGVPERPSLRDLASTVTPVPDSRFTVRRDPVKGRAIKLQRELLDMAQSASGLEIARIGTLYEALIVQDIHPTTTRELKQKVTEVSTEGRRRDVGEYVEITISGRSDGLNSHKLRQLWIDLFQNGKVKLVVPELSTKAREQLRLLAAAAEQHRDGTVSVEIRETLPD